GGQGLERRRARRRRRGGWRSGGAKARGTVRIGDWPGEAAVGSCRRTVRGPQRRGGGRGGGGAVPARAAAAPAAGWGGREGALAAGSKRVGRQAEKRWRAGALAA